MIQFQNNLVDAERGIMLSTDILDKDGIVTDLKRRADIITKILNDKNAVHFPVDTQGVKLETPLMAIAWLFSNNKMRQTGERVTYFAYDADRTCLGIITASSDGHGNYYIAQTVDKRRYDAQCGMISLVEKMLLRQPQVRSVNVEVDYYAIDTMRHYNLRRLGYKETRTSHEECLGLGKMDFVLYTKYNPAHQPVCVQRASLKQAASVRSYRQNQPQYV